MNLREKSKLSNGTGIISMGGISLSAIMEVEHDNFEDQTHLPGPRHHHMTSQIVLPHSYKFLLFVPLQRLSYLCILRPDDVPMFSAKQDAATTGFRNGNGKAWICHFGAAWCPKSCGFRLHLELKRVQSAQTAQRRL